MTIGSRNATAAQKVALESRIRDLSRDISEAAAAFRAWLRDQDLNVQRLAGDVDLAEINALSERIQAVASAVYAQLRTEPGIMNIADAIALLEMDDDPPIAAVTAGLRALAERNAA
jgi:hypothetical protein